MILIGLLLGEKTVLNEFVAYISLANLKDSMAFYEERSMIIATYILCGFANFASIGIQIGGIGVLAPDRRVDLSKRCPLCHPSQHKKESSVGTSHT